MIHTQVWNDLRTVKPFEKVNETPTHFRVLVFSFDETPKFDQVKGCWETNNFVIQPDGLVLGYLPENLQKKPVAYCVVSNCCSTDYAKQYFESLNWPGNNSVMHPEYFQ